MWEVSVSDNHKVIVLVINNSHEIVEKASEGEKAEALYEAARGVWEINRERAAAAEYVLAMCNGEVKEVYRIKAWYPAGTLKYNHRPKEDTHIEGRWEFEKTVDMEEGVHSLYKGKQITVRLYGSVTYVNC